jgi:hypothetical protein
MDKTGTPGEGRGLETGAFRALRGMFFFSCYVFYFSNGYLHVDLFNHPKSTSSPPTSNKRPPPPPSPLPSHLDASIRQRNSRSSSGSSRGLRRDVSRALGKFFICFFLLLLTIIIHRCTTNPIGPHYDMKKAQTTTYTVVWVF